MSENDEEMEDQGVDGDNMKAALELGRLASEENDICGAELARFIWGCYKKLNGEIEDDE